MIPTELRTRYQPYTLADLVHYLSGADIAGLSPRQYAHLSRDVITATSTLERDHYYQFGVLPDHDAA